jgi:hypothetical protein
MELILPFCFIPITGALFLASIRSLAQLIRRLEVAEGALSKLPIISGCVSFGLNICVTGFDSLFSKPQPSAIETPFWKELKNNVNMYFIESKQSSKGNTFMYLKVIIIVRR